MQHYSIAIGSATWLWGLIITMFSITLVLYIPTKLSSDQRVFYRKVVASCYIISFFAFHVYALSISHWTRQDSLPLHLCSISMVCGIIALFTLNKTLFEWSCFFGIAGGLNSILSPEFTNGYTTFYHIQFYFDHGGVLMMPLLLGIHEGMKPREWSWLKILINLNILAIIMFGFNWLNGSNYMYVNTKPIADNPLLIGNWPWYIFVLEFVAIIHFYIIYVFFHRFKKWK